MGSVGSNDNRNNSETKSFVGKSVTTLNDIIAYKEGRTYEDIYTEMREKFNIPNANTKQLETLRGIIKGINQYDRSYGEKTPYNISYFNIRQSQLSAEEREIRKDIGMRNTTQPIQVTISTEPNIDNAYIRMLDAKDHEAFIGANGGLYTYTRGGKKKSLDEFSVHYGKHQ